MRLFKAQFCTCLDPASDGRQPKAVRAARLLQKARQSLSEKLLLARTEIKY